MAVGLLAVVSAYAAAPSVTNIVAKERYPWKGVVDIEYEVVCEDADLELTVSAYGKDAASASSVRLATVTGEGAPGTTVKAGKRKMRWNVSADAPTLKSKKFAFTIYVWDGAAQYMIIDLAGGTAAESYPVSYLPDAPPGGWTDEYKTDKLVMRHIEAGVFTMGSPSGELGRYSNEDLHQVTLTQGFYIGVFEVTQRQWELVMGTKPSYFSNATYYATRPVEQVSYNLIRGSSAGAGWPGNNSVDATSFMGKLRSKTGQAFDLPTEAQWEYACRAGTTTALNSGKNLTDIYTCPNMAEVGRYWYNGGSSSPSNGTTAVGSAAVGSYLPNQWGLYDMHGNVWEWCLDWWTSNLGTAGVTDPKGAASSSIPVLRGGAWGYSADGCRSANRGNNTPGNSRLYFGFRTALIPVQ